MAVLTLTGIVDDGSRRSPGVPLSSRKQIDVIRGTDLMVRVKLRHPDGRKVDLSAGTPVTTLTVKGHPDNDADLTVTGVVETPAEEAIVGFDLTAALTAGLAIGRRMYDVRHSQSGDVHAVIPLSSFVVLG